jgi:hypothetical protein
MGLQYLPRVTQTELACTDSFGSNFNRGYIQSGLEGLTINTGIPDL